jgi:CheY-like chemotaxis protein
MKGVIMRDDTLILIAEDDDGHYALIERNLARAGISNQIIRLKDGQEALDLLEGLKTSSNPNSKKPCLMILDIRMPKVDGFEVLAYMKNDELLRKIPVIVLTTAGDKNAVDKCQRLGCNMYVVKPVEYDQFVEAMNRIGHFLSIIEVPVVHN